ncbi:hypothetical protein D915_004978 [Fasciola hepatica]|uniref:Uncharacterized protein n=1 Tax=Fasciola hepatica TaxID=6192 RepID=A0A4E0RT26_FASHE|nr:hypothetical protein D915_004978 [Fasciola hepatica]
MNSKSPRRIGFKTRGRRSLEKSKSKSFLKPSRNLTPEPKQQNFCAVMDRRHTDDLLEETNSLKLKIAFLSAENGSLKSRCRQLTDQVMKKDKELTTLTDPTENAKLLQNLGENRLQTVRAFRQLHQRLYKLEGQLKEKEAQYSQIVTDLKFTRVEELRIQLETAFAEIERLQNLARNQSIELDHWRGLQQIRSNKRKNDPEFMELVRRVKTLGQVIKSMDEQKKELMARNDYLVNRMREVLANNPSSIKDFEKNSNQLGDQEENGALQDAEGEQNNSKESVLLAKLVESKLSEGVRYNQPIARPIPARNDFADELVSARNQTNSLERSNKHLREEVAFYKRQMELTKLQLDNVSENQSSARTFESSPRLRQSLRKARDPISANVSTTANLTKDEQSAILIQRAWRQHRTRGLGLRKHQRAQDMQERAEAREKEAATRLIKSTIHGHLSRESSLRVNQNNDVESVTDEMDTVTFATESSGTGSVISQENKSKGMTDLKAAIHGHLEREKSLSSLQTSDSL